MKSLIVFLVLLVCPQLSLAAVDGWRMNQFTGKPDYYQTGIDSATVADIAASTTTLSISTAAIAVRVAALEVSTATLDSTLSAEIQVRQELATQVAIDTTAIGGVSLSAYNEFTSSNSFSSILIASGTHGAGDDLAAAGAGSRFFYYPKKSAFRAGQITGTEWDDGSIGLWSGAVGYNCKGVGEGSMCFGYSSETTGPRSVALGTGAKAGGEGMAFGPNTVENYGGGQSVSLGGEGNSANVSRSATVGGYSNRVGPTSGASNGKNSFIAGGSGNTTEADYSGIISAVNVNLDASADNSVAMGHDASPVTYSSSETLILHNMNLVVSTSPTGVQYGIEKDGDVTAAAITADSFTGSGAGLTSIPDGALSSNVALKDTDNNFSQTQTFQYGVVAATGTFSSTATLAALSATGKAAFTSATSTVTFAGSVKAQKSYQGVAAAGTTMATTFGAHLKGGTLAAGANTGSLSSADAGNNGGVVLVVWSMVTADGAYHVYDMAIQAHGNSYNTQSASLLNQMTDGDLTLSRTNFTFTFTNASAQTAYWQVKVLALTDLYSTKGGY